MPDGSHHADLAAALPPVSSLDGHSADLAVIKSLLPSTPHAYKLMATALGVIDNTSVDHLGNGLSERLSNLEDALEEEALTLPVRTAEDAVSLLSFVTRGIELFEEFNLDDCAREERVSRMRKAMEASLPFLAGAASVDLGQIGCGSFRMVGRDRVAAAMMVSCRRAI